MLYSRQDGYDHVKRYIQIMIIFFSKKGREVAYSIEKKNKIKVVNTMS